LTFTKIDAKYMCIRPECSGERPFPSPILLKGEKFSLLAVIVATDLHPFFSWIKTAPASLQRAIKPVALQKQ